MKIKIQNLRLIFRCLVVIGVFGGGFLAPIFLPTSPYQFAIDYQNNLSTRLQQGQSLQPLPSSYNFEIPYYQQTTSYWCGPASLEMLFDFYGPDISQSPIAAVAATSDPIGTYVSDMLRASHYSYLSDTTSTPPDGYGVRQLGYAAYSHHWTGTYDAISTSVKTLLTNNVPILVLTYYDASHATGHYRVLKGYDDASNDFILHDPWYSGTYQGPDETIDQTLLITDLWTRYNQWGMVIQPWVLQITPNPPLILPGQPFTLAAHIECPCPAPFSLSEFPIGSPSAQLVLPDGFVLESGSAVISINLGTGDADVSWTVIAPSFLVANTYEFNIEASGTVSGVGTQAGSYTDRIGSEATITLNALSSGLLVVVFVGLPIIIVIVVVAVFIFRRRRKRRLEEASA